MPDFPHSISYSKLFLLNIFQDAPIVLYNLTQPTEEWRTNALESEGLKPNHNQNGNGELGYDNQAAETRDTKF